MGRSATLSPLGLYEWDNTIFDLMQIPSALDKNVLIPNLLAETAELEVLYPNPVVFKNLVGVWSHKQIDIWNRLYQTTQYEYNPIENYNRYETGTTEGAGSTAHTGTDTTTETTTHGGSNGRTETIATSGKDTVDMTRAEGGTESKAGTDNTTLGGQDTTTMTRAEGGTEAKAGTDNTTFGGRDTTTMTRAEGGIESESTTAGMAQGGSDTVTGTDTKGHWIAGFDSAPSGQSDGLVKQTRDEDDASTITTYGKTEQDTGSKTTNFGKTENNQDQTAYGKTESETTSETTTFGKTETNQDQTTYGKTENVQETHTFGETINKQGGMTHGEKVTTSNEGGHTLHAHGNIGVTTTQQLIREQRNIDLFNLYDIIIEDFKMRFCILIY